MHGLTCGARCPWSESYRPCTKPAGHAAAGDPFHCWPWEAPAYALPRCRLCGAAAARCPCPVFDAAGRSTVARPDEDDGR